MHSSLTSQDNIHFSTSAVCVHVLLRGEHDVYLVTSGNTHEGGMLFNQEFVDDLFKQFFNHFVLAYLANCINISTQLRR